MGGDDSGYRSVDVVRAKRPRGRRGAWRRVQAGADNRGAAGEAPFTIQYKA